MPQTSQTRNTVIFRFHGGHETAAQPIGITVGAKFYALGDPFADENTSQILGFMGATQRLPIHMLLSLMLCQLERQVTLGRLAHLGIWTAAPRTIHQRLLEAFGTVKQSQGGSGKGHLIIRFARPDDATSEPGDAVNKGPGRDTADEDTVLRLVWPPGYQVGFDTEDRAHTYVAQLEREAKFPGATAERDDRYVYVSSRVRDSELFMRIRSLGLQAHDAAAARNGSWLLKLANSAAVIINVGANVTPWQYAELGFARGKEVPILVRVGPCFNPSAVMASFETPVFQADDPNLMMRIQQCVVPPAGQEILQQITDLVLRAMNDSQRPRPKHALPSRIQMETSIANATRKQILFGLQILAAGRGLGRFLNLFTHYADRQYQTEIMALIDKAQKERVSLTSIVRAICMPELFTSRMGP